MEHIFEEIAIIGPGLIGGSMGAAIRGRKLAKNVVGIGRRDISLKKALKAGAIDRATTHLQEGTKNADLVVLATPVSTFGRIAEDLKKFLRSGAILTEVGSTKESVIQAVQEHFSERRDVSFIPTHPMAGSEKGGPENSRADLFEDAACIFTLLEGTPKDHKDKLEKMWEKLGANVHFMSPRQHDILVGRISHLPHLAAAALINTIEGVDGKFAGGGLLDTTRIASGDPELWKSICKSNPEKIISALDAFSASLLKAREMIADEDFEALGDWLAAAKEKRDGIIRSRENREAT